jgi:histidyl-tRNA synthetase
MLHQRHRDVVLVYREQIHHHLVFHQLHQDVVVHLVCDTEMMMVRHQIFHLVHLDHLVVVVNHRDVVVVALQNLDEQNQDEVLPYFHRAENLDAAVHRLHLAVLVDVDHRKFQMDYFQDALVDAVDAAHLEFQMDYFQDVVGLEKEYLLV